MHPDFKNLIDTASFAGASDVCILPSSSIVVEQRLAEICHQPRCENYGLSLSCPPHVEGPHHFQELQGKTSYAMVIRIDVPSEVLFSSERDEVMRLLHEIVAAVERQAVDIGYNRSKGFAGGSCKRFFCADHSDCRVISGVGGCRNPGSARQSMSGFGINVGKMMAAAGWDDKKNNTVAAPAETETSWVAGLVMIG